ncbi:MAG TPA: NIPSNAP family protein [Rudaea sp.]|jgi:hypothetical protein
MKTIHRRSRAWRSTLLGTLAAVTGALSTTAADAADVARGGDAARCCRVVELRQYALHPQRFDTFATLFEREFIEPQEAAGITVIGQFRNLDDPDRFVWLRGFRDMPSRATALQTFYGSTLWKSLRDEANANFTDTDNVLLLRPSAQDTGFDLRRMQRTALGAPAGAAHVFVAAVWSLDAAAAPDFPRWFDTSARPLLARAGVSVLASFETEPTPNNFPRLPVREGEHVFVWIARFGDRAQADAALERATGSAAWRKAVAPELTKRLKGQTQALHLVPTARSLLR